MKTGQVVLIGVGVIAVAYLLTRPKSPAVLVKPVTPAPTPLQQQTAALATDAQSAATAANALTNLVNAVSDATSSDNTSSDTVDPNQGIYSDPTLSGWGGLYGSE